MDVQSGRSLPKNFRQIGSAEKSTKIYIEDYVYTFMRKLSEEEDISVGALIGNNVTREGAECVFVSGMIKASGCVFSDDRVVITDNTWAAVFENVKKYFDGMTVCGWFVSSKNSQICKQAAVSGIYSCGNHEAALIYMRDRENDEDFVYRVTAQGKSLLSGYYIYYERNEQMQEYMVDTTGAKSVDPPPVNIMNRLENSERKKAEEAAKRAEKRVEAETVSGEKKNSSRTIYFAASLLLISFLALGYSVYRRGDAPTDIPVISNITDMLKGREETTGAAGSMPSGIIIENAEGIVKEEAADGQTESSGEAGVLPSDSEGDSSNAAEGDGDQTAAVNQPVLDESEAVSELQTSLATEAASEPQAPPVTEAANAVNIAPGSAYTVQAGDTLTSICIKAYGKEDPVKIEEIRNLNGLESADYIFVGQVLTMP